MKRILFICKHRSSYGISYGLINSARFVADALNKLNGVVAKVVDVIDNNHIDREVHKFKPTHVIIEALWVIPNKFPELLKIHTTINWYVRIHSKPAFIANEGIAMEWLAAYSDIQDQFSNFRVMANDAEFSKILASTFSYGVDYTPNIYQKVCRKRKHERQEKVTHIGCFGAIRPMKNHLAQALAAIQYADDTMTTVYFHINSDRIEQKGNEVLKNLRALFDRTARSILVEHQWMSHATFLELVGEMDIAMQASLSETFNIVAADCVSLGVPIIVCPDIYWAPSLYKTDPNSVEKMTKALHRVWHWRMLGKWWARFGLWYHNRKALKQWKRVLGIA